MSKKAKSFLTVIAAIIGALIGLYIVGRILLTVLAIIVFSPKYEEPNQEYLSQAALNAPLYIKEKYGIEATVKKTKAIYEKTQGMRPTLSERVAVTMAYNDREFTVIIPGDSENTNGKDDFQKDEIIDAFLKECSDILGADIKRYQITYAYQDSDKDRFLYTVHECFTGNNLKEVMTESGTNYTNITLALVDEDIKNVDVDELSKLSGSENIRIYNFKTENDLKIYDKDIIFPDVEDYVFYLKDALVYSEFYKGYMDCTEHELDSGLKYYYLGGTYCNIEPTEPFEYTGYNGKTQTIKKAYSVDTDAKYLVVYMPRTSIFSVKKPLIRCYYYDELMDKPFDKVLFTVHNVPKGYVGGELHCDFTHDVKITLSD